MTFLKTSMFDPGFLCRFTDNKCHVLARSSICALMSPQLVKYHEVTAVVRRNQGLICLQGRKEFNPG